MKRIVAVCLVLLVSCTPSDEGVAEPGAIASVDTTATAEPTPSPVETLAATEACEGLGRPRRHGEITFFEGSRLIGVSPDGLHRRCLADLGSEMPSGGADQVWNAPGNRVLLGSTVLGPRSTIDALPRGWRGQWSRPTGTSLIRITRDGRLEKRSLVDGSVTDISFLAHHDAVAYHPAGTHVAVSGEARDGSYGVYIATNVGTEPQLLARGEESRYVDQLVFSQGGRALYFVADHGKKVHLHRLSLNPPSDNDGAIVQEVEFDTLSIADSISNVTLSPFSPPDAVAWTQNGDCAAGTPSELRTEDFGVDEIHVPEGIADRSIVPIAWLPDGRLVVRARSTGCGTAQPSDVYVLGGGHSPVLIAEQEVGGAAVRFMFPPPPPPPDIEQEVVA